jgi:hypothetical protein
LEMEGHLIKRGALQNKFLQRVPVAVPSSRPQAIGSLEKELAAFRPTED